MPDPHLYQEIRARLQQPVERPIIFPNFEETECVRLIGPDPNWTPAWGGVYNKTYRMEPEVAHACALAAKDTAWAMIGPRELAEASESEEWNLVRIALRLADMSLNIDEDEPASVVWQHKAATAAILAYADAVATDKGFNPFDYQYSYFPRVDALDHVNIFVGDSRHLELSHYPEIHGDIEVDDLWGLMEDWWSNGHGLGTVDELGAMSEAPFLSEELTVEDDGTTVVESPLWYYRDYMTRSPLDELREDRITSPWTPYYPGGSYPRGNPGETWDRGRTLGHQQFFSVWWKLCRCRIPIYLLDPR